jgi:DNA-binding beta-propeller fold protein YncE
LDLVQKRLGIFLAGTAAAALLCACSNGSQEAASIPAAASPSNVHVLPDKKAKTEKDLFVSDVSLNAIEILKNTSWADIGSISDYVDQPDGNWVDAQGNLYLANSKGAYIEEFVGPHHKPKYTYSSGMENPVNVTTDSNANVYVADFEAKDVGEFAQGNSTRTETCSPGGWATGIAVDKDGDVFVAFYDEETGEGTIAEYAGGLSGCNETLLAPTLEFPGGIVLDKKGDLVVVDTDAAAVDVIAPPYTSITGTLGSGYTDPINVRINAKNDQAYVADYELDEVFVLSYPGGTTQATLGTANGLKAPIAAVDGQNYNP